MWNTSPKDNSVIELSKAVSGHIYWPKYIEWSSNNTSCNDPIRVDILQEQYQLAVQIGSKDI